MEIRTLAKILHKNQPCTMPAYNTWCFNNLKHSVCFQVGATSFAEILDPWANNATAKMLAICIPTNDTAQLKTQSYTLDTGHR
jgi:hypothetical protein